jgi:argininosuccinate lyase
MAAATYLSKKGVPFRKAHEIIGNAVRLGLDKNLELNAIPLVDLKKLSEHLAEDFFAAISLRSTVDCHDVPGGTATSRVKQALNEARARLAAALADTPGASTHQKSARIKEGA